MKLGLENKRATIALSVLGLVLAVAIYSSFFSGPGVPSTPATARVAAPATADLSSDDSNAPRSLSAVRTEEFLPVLHKKHGEKPLDPLSIDPTLRLDLLAKLDEVPAAGSGRDLFNFGKPAPAKPTGPEPTVAINKGWDPIGPRITPPPPKPKPPTAPPPPPIKLKYYGICTVRADGFKTAFFMDGDDILVEAEGATFKGRYRLLRIGVNSAVVEDLQYKHEQTLPLAEDAVPGTGL